MKRIAAIAGIGIQAAYGISTTRIRRSVTEWTIPAIGVRPPFLTLAAVLAIAPVGAYYTLIDYNGTSGYVYNSYLEVY